METMLNCPQEMIVLRNGLSMGEMYCLVIALKNGFVSQKGKLWIGCGMLVHISLPWGCWISFPNSPTIIKLCEPKIMDDDCIVDEHFHVG
jgi:hypothetical protein